MEGYTPSTVDYLKDGFENGFSLDYSGSSIPLHSNNLVSASQNPEVVHKTLAKELASHRLAGPFKSPPFQTFTISPLGVVPKKNPGEFRLIHNLSFPKGTSVNDGILPEDSSLSYSTI